VATTEGRGFGGPATSCYSLASDDGSGLAAAAFRWLLCSSASDVADLVICSLRGRSQRRSRPIDQATLAAILAADAAGYSFLRIAADLGA